MQWESEPQQCAGPSPLLKDLVRPPLSPPSCLLPCLNSHHNLNVPPSPALSNRSPAERTQRHLDLTGTRALHCWVVPGITRTRCCHCSTGFGFSCLCHPERNHSPYVCPSWPLVCCCPVKHVDFQKGETAESGWAQHTSQQAHFSSCLAKKTDILASVPRAESLPAPSYPAQMKKTIQPAGQTAANKR